MSRALYPKDWDKISQRIKEARGFECEGCGQQGNIVSNDVRGNNYLTVHHKDYNPGNNDPSNLMVLCQKCHLKLQQGVLPSRIRLTCGQLPLF